MVIQWRVIRSIFWVLWVIRSLSQLLNFVLTVGATAATDNMEMHRCAWVQIKHYLQKKKKKKVVSQIQPIGFSLPSREAACESGGFCIAM